jgi:hypothetical protein
MSEDSADVDESKARNEDQPSSWAHPVDWESVTPDPTPESLGYEVSQWELIPVTDNDQVIFLPGNEEDLADDAFVVLDEGDLCDVVTRR